MIGYNPNRSLASKVTVIASMAASFSGCLPLFFTLILFSSFGSEVMNMAKKYISKGAILGAVLLWRQSEHLEFESCVSG